MDPKTVSPGAKAIQQRFFESIDALIAIGKITGARKIHSTGNKRAGLNTFCKQHGLHYPKYSTIRTVMRNPEKIGTYKFIDIDALSILVEYYGVSAVWLLTGRGTMFK